jgi:hypothetical protein
MADYIKATDFSVKDGLISGDPDKIVKGTELDDEFDAIAIAVQTKADVVSPSFLGTVTAPTVGTTTNNTQVATTAFVRNALQFAYPVGSIYINATNATNPGTLLGFGTWVAFGAGRVMVGFNASDPLFDSAEETGGSKNSTVVEHTHTFTSTTSSNGTHTHGVWSNGTGINEGPRLFGNSGTNSVAGQNATSTGYRTTLQGSGEQALQDSGAHNHTLSGTTASTGSTGTNTNLQPYITVFMWKRVS